MSGGARPYRVRGRAAREEHRARRRRSAFATGLLRSRTVRGALERVTRGERNGRRRARRGAPFALLALVACSAEARTQEPAAARMRLGVNLDAVRDWSTDAPFADAFRRARVWQTRDAGGSTEWSTGLGAHVPTDAAGWPTRVPFHPGTGAPPQIVHTILTRLNGAGTYTFSFEGEGTLRLKLPGGGARLLTADAPRTQELVVDAPGALSVEILESAEPDHLRGFRLIGPIESLGEERGLFSPPFVERLRPFSVLRFMDWGRTNGSPLWEWAARTTPDSYTQARPEGVALEHMLELARAVGADAWLCVPHAATDDFVRRCAERVAELRAPGQRIWVEYSNETWNPGSAFPQTAYVRERGLALGLDADPAAAGHAFAAKRSAEIWEAFARVLPADALVPVLATQSASTWVTERRVAALDPDGPRPKVLAIAPYFGEAYRERDLPPEAGAYPTVEELVGDVSRRSIARVREQVAAQRRLAEAAGCELVCYEGGQHFVGLGRAKDDERLTDLLHAANRHPEMGARYDEYLAMLDGEGVTTFCAFSFCGAWSKHGSWGALERIDQPLDEAPKFAALARWARAGTATGTDR